MAVIARDQVASDQLVYAWPFPIGPEAVELSCGAEEIAVICPAWVIGHQLGPGRHHWRTSDPAKPTNVYFVLTGPVEIPFDMMTQFVIPSTQQPVRLRATGSVLARCIEPAMLVSQFVGLPFDNINDGIMRSVGQSCERLLSRVLVRRVVASATPIAVTDPNMLPSIVDEMTAYNPTAGAVTGVAFVRFNQLVIQADDGGMGGGMWNSNQGWTAPVEAQPQPYATGGYQFGGDSVPGVGYPQAQSYPEQPFPTGGFAVGSNPPPPDAVAAPAAAATPPPTPAPAISSASGVVASGEISSVSGEIGGAKRTKSVPPGQIEAPKTPEEDTTEEKPAETPKFEAPVFPQGMRVLVSAPNGTLHAAVVCSHRGEYYEVEIGSTKDVIWVPVANVIPDR
jgi:hypothetical protein